MPVHQIWDPKLYNLYTVFSLLNTLGFILIAPTSSTLYQWLPNTLPYILKSLTSKKQMRKFLSAKFQKMISPNHIILRIQRQEGKQCRSR